MTPEPFDVELMNPLPPRWFLLTALQNNDHGRILRPKVLSLLSTSTIVAKTKTNVGYYTTPTERDKDGQFFALQ